MNLYPKRHYFIELNKSSSYILNLIQEKTTDPKLFIADYRKQSFIGKINSNEFQLTLSIKIFGFFCLFYGEFKNETGELEVKLHKYAKYLFSSIFISYLLALISTILNSNYLVENVLGIVIHTLLLRFVFIKYGFRYFTKKGIRELSQIDGIKSINLKKKTHF